MSRRDDRRQRNRHAVAECRRRQRKRLALHKVEVDDAVYDMAIRTGSITEEEAAHRKLMDAALSQMLMDAARQK